MICKNSTYILPRLGVVSCGELRDSICRCRYASAADSFITYSGASRSSGTFCHD